MASLDVIALDPVTPQLRAPGVGDTYHFCRVVEFQDGTDAAPSITNVGDTNTGIYWPNADELAVSTGGVQRMSLGATTVFNETGADVDFRVEGDADANLLFVDASTDRVAIGANDPGSKLDVNGAFRLRGSSSGYVGLQAAAAAGSTTYTLPAADGSSGFVLSTNGAGVLSWVDSDLNGVDGPASSTDNAVVRWDGTTGKLIQNSNAILTDAGFLTLENGAVINEAGADSDTRIEGDTDANLFFADASTDRIGVGTASPAFKLDVAGTGKVSALYLTDMTAGSGALYYSAGAENRLTLANYNVGGTIFFETNGGAYAGAIDASQNWGIGTTTPNARLDVNGAMRLRGSTSGYVGLQAAAVAGTTTYTLPSADGSNGQVLTTNGTGTLSWTTNAGGDVTGPASASDNAIARFDGTTGKLIQNSAVFVDDDGDVGIGTSTPSEKLQIESGTPRIYMNATTNSASAGMYFRVKDGSGNADNSGIYLEPTANIANRYINFSASNIGSDMAIVAGGNVGIGTISPSNRLSVAGSTGTIASFTNGATADFSIICGSSITSLNAGGANILAFQTGGTERARIDSSGNLGLGVTPSAWGSGFRALQIRAASLSDNNFGDTYLGANAYFDGSNWKYYQNTEAPALLSLENGAFKFNTAAGGTAGNTISFTQAMTLDASGNLGVGTTSPSDSAAFGRAIDVAGGASTGAAVYVRAAASATNYLALGQDTAGNSYIINRANAPMLFYTNNTERARITSDGNFLVGTTSGSYKIQSSSPSGADRDMFLSGIDGVTNGVHWAWVNSSSTINLRFGALPTTASAANLYSDSVNAEQVYRSTSSIRYKKDIESVDHKFSDAALNLRPVWYRSKAEGDNKEWSWYGLIAEEVAEVEPRLVHWTYPEDAFDVETIDGVIKKTVKEGAKRIPDGVQYERLSVLLLDIVKRQNARLEQLEAKVAALETK